VSLEPRELDANGLRFRCLETRGGGEPVVLLHGFPETSRMWTGLMERLGDEGYHCLAPDQRGYSPGARPVDVDQYKYEDIASDVHALAMAAGFERFHLVGHDWGAIAGWAQLAIDDSPVRSWTSLSIPHYRAWAQAIVDDPEQETYRGMLAVFTNPDKTAEATFSADDFALPRATWVHSSPEEVEDYLEVFRQPGALTAAFNWYRATGAHSQALEGAAVDFGPVTTPTLLIWGKNDPYIRRMSVDMARPYMRGDYRVVEVDAGHWLVQEAPEVVHDEILEHLNTNRT